ncbi:MAG: hypothetical protein KF781_04735 [Chitinophagaceae bacterium]|nr:hypothetical protein [Chitinophagaceae bacterium]MCW5904609.1 hypothetical protein [Chitinophagaceae bacterium]
MKNFLASTSFKKTLYGLFIIAPITLIIEFGFRLPYWSKLPILCIYAGLLIISVITTPIKYFFRNKKFVLRAFIFDLLNIAFIVYCLNEQYTIGLNNISPWLRIGLVLTFIRELAPIKFNYRRSVLNPALLFVLTFLIIIIIGSLLLMLPTATYQGISYIDALFTSTSAVCVTGLTVVNTATYFTPIGHTIILLLIQAGGLGILTFTSFFSYFFLGGVSYENQIALGSLNSLEKQLGNVFSTLKRILGITFFIEAVGAVIIYFNLDATFFPSKGDEIFFAIFHSISAFCNAGISILPNGLMHENFITNYPFQLTLIGLLIFGGLGFPIVVNILSHLKYTVKRYIFWFIYGKNIYKPRALTINSKINLITVIILIVLGTAFIFANEFYNILHTHQGAGKLVTALFTATTPRSAGFNSIDFSQLHHSSILVIILLMWIGASPSSTGGGIKTSTFAIAILNFYSIARGKNKIEIWRREIADASIKRAFAVMALSLFVIGLSIYLMAFFNRNFSISEITFECFSAFSTAGLSLGITEKLNEIGKVILICTMFVGRVTALTLLIALFKKAKSLRYRYPTEEILIN